MTGRYGPIAEAPCGAAAGRAHGAGPASRVADSTVEGVVESHAECESRSAGADVVSHRPPSGLRAGSAAQAPATSRTAGAGSFHSVLLVFRIERVRRGPLRWSGRFVVAPRCLHVHAVRRNGRPSRPIRITAAACSSTSKAATSSAAHWAAGVAFTRTGGNADSRVTASHSASAAIFDAPRTATFDTADTNHSERAARFFVAYLFPVSDSLRDARVRRPVGDQHAHDLVSAVSLHGSGAVHHGDDQRHDQPGGFEDGRRVPRGPGRHLRA